MGKKAGCVPVRRNPDSSEWQVLLIQSRWTPQVWLFPKGTVETMESAKDAAVRETCEEAGVLGDLGPKLGAWDIQRRAKHKQKMWLLYVTTQFAADDKRWRERKKRARVWNNLEHVKRIFTAAPEEFQRPELMEMLLKAESALLAKEEADHTNEAVSHGAASNVAANNVAANNGAANNGAANNGAASSQIEKAEPEHQNA